MNQVKNGKSKTDRNAFETQTSQTKRIHEYNGHEQRCTLITGGAGFIGTNLAHRLLSQGCPVIIFDNLSRAGVEKNLVWLMETYGGLVQVEIGDIRNKETVQKVVNRASQVFHLAAQVAVTTSLVNPIYDFEVNAQGTLYLLEALRALGDNAPPLLFTSTNKVYGALDDVKLTEKNTRYQPEDLAVRTDGISETRPVEFHSPYGCSKGTAEQYVLDYARTFNLPAAVFRMSCIYGEHQFGTEDQGWVAHFLIRVIEGKPLTLYGDGKQVRDVLYVGDLVDAFLLAQKNMEKISGQAFNIGGGAANAVSLLELIDLIGEMHGESFATIFSDWRHADQKYYVSNTSKFEAETGWEARIDVSEGVEKLYRWLLESRKMPVSSFTEIKQNQTAFPV